MQDVKQRKLEKQRKKKKEIQKDQKGEMEKEIVYMKEVMKNERKRLILCEKTLRKRLILCENVKKVKKKGRKNVYVKRVKNYTKTMLKERKLRFSKIRKPKCQ